MLGDIGLLALNDRQTPEGIESPRGQERQGFSFFMLSTGDLSL